MNYLDSVALASRESAWVCCKGDKTEGILNDYLPGWTHHPIDDPNYSLRPPRNVRPPERGKEYEMVKMKWNEQRNCYDYDQLVYIVYTGPHYSDEDLLSMENISKAYAYYPRRKFKILKKDKQIDGIEDCRTTLQWLPRIQTDDNGTFAVEFLTSDINSKFNLSVLSISETGIINQIVYPVMVR
ncbi:MAG: hypothetical protein NC095_03830 [Muribaculum sp.]|nr:hypothetical protein [Muribaculum sp.]